MLVDSPGMIDSPVSKESSFDRGSGAFDRGYDFEGTVKWFAERADVILLFFDPDKPGTTGETLSIMTNSLAGMDHKLHIILNKADQVCPPSPVKWPTTLVTAPHLLLSILTLVLLL